MISSSIEIASIVHKSLDVSGMHPLSVAHRFSQWLSLPIVIDFACWKSISPLLDYPDTTRAKLFVPCKCKRLRLQDEARQGRFPLEEVEWSVGGEGRRSMSNYRTVVPSVVFSQDTVMANMGQERNETYKNPVTRKILFLPHSTENYASPELSRFLANTWSRLKIERVL